MHTKFKFNLLSLIITAFIALPTIALHAQSGSARAGIKGGLNASNLYINNVDDENMRLGFNLGVYGQIFSSDAFALQPELLYTTKGAQADYGGVIHESVKFHLNYLELPLLAVFKLGKDAEIHAGGYASYLLNANIVYEGDFANRTDELNRDNFKSYDYGLSGGVGFNFGTVQLGARYNYGLVAISDSSTAHSFLGNSKNSNATIFMAVNLNQNKMQ